MEYEKTLKDLRARMQSLETGKEPSLTTQGLVPQRTMAQESKSTEDILEQSRAWLSEVKQEAQKLRTESSGNFASGFNRGMSMRPKKRPAMEETQVQKDERVAPLVARRGERPSNYAPDKELATPGTKFSSKEQFVDQLYPKAIEVGKMLGIDPRIIIAQAALESAWGKSAPSNNFFGIKSHGEEGGKVSSTLEEVNGKMVRSNESFRTYDSPEASFEDYGDFLVNNDRYLPLLAAKGLDAQIKALAESGYATDSKYGSKIKSIVDNLPDPKDYI